MFDFLAPIWNLIIYDPMLNALLLLYHFIPNYGVAIILFTLAIAGLTMPLRIKSQKSMRAQQEKTARIKPRLDEIQKKYKDNPQQLQQAQMKLYQEEGLVNPLNSGCLLTLIPFPIFIGLYSVITSVMGSTPEQLLTLSSHLYPVFPLAGTLVPVNPYFLGLNLAASPLAQAVPSPWQYVVAALVVIPVIAVQWVQQKMMTPAMASVDPQQSAMNQQMQLIMPIFFGWIVLGTPTGLSLYWIAFGLLTVVQQYFTGGWGTLFPQSAAKKNQRPKRLSAAANTEPKKVEPAVTRVESGASNGQSNGDEDGGEIQAKPAVPATASSGSKKGKKKRGKKS